MKKLSKKAAEKIVDAAFNKFANGVQIPIMKLGSILDIGHAALENGLDVEAAVKAAIEAVAVKS